MTRVALLALFAFALPACDSADSGSIEGLWVNADQADSYLNVSLPSVEFIFRQGGDCWYVDESSATYDSETGTYVVGGSGFLSGGSLSLESGSLVYLGGFDVSGRERVRFEPSENSRADLFDRFDLCGPG